MKKFTCIFCLLISFSSFSQQKTLQNLEEMDALSKKTAELYKEKKINDLFDNLNLYWPVLDTQLKAMKDKTLNSLGTIADNYGEATGIRKGKVSKLQDLALRTVYFVTYERSILRLTLVFYKTPRGWMVNSFKWDDKFEEEFE